MSAKELPVSFYRASVLDKGRKRSSGADWAEGLRAVSLLPLVERTHDDDLYDVHVEGDLVLVGAHRVLNTDFMTAISSESITDIMDDAAASEGARRFAHTTVMAFLPRHNAIAVVRGGANSPRAISASTNFLQRHLSLPRGAHWFVEAIITPDQTDSLRKAKGVSLLEARYETTRLIDDADPVARGIASHFDKIAADIGGELIIDVKVRIAPGSKSSSTMSGFKDLVFGDLPRLVGGKRKVQARAVYDDDSNELLDLVAGKLASSIELNEHQVESRRYTALLDGLRTVSVEMQDEVDRIIGG